MIVDHLCAYVDVRSSLDVPRPDPARRARCGGHVLTHAGRLRVGGTVGCTHSPRSGRAGGARRRLHERLRQHRQGRRRRPRHRHGDHPQPRADPHDYEATPADAAAVNEAKLVVVNGGGYDDFATKLVDAAAAKPTVIDVVDLSGLEPAEPATPEPANASGGEEHGEFNEHVWYSLPTVEKLADRLATDLATIDPAGTTTYTGNAAAFKTQVDGLIAKLNQIKATHAGDKVAITEPVPLYLVQDAGLDNATPEEFSKAVEEGNDPPAAVLNQTLDLFTSKTVKVLLPNAQTESASTKQVEQAATAAGVPVVPVTETLPAGTDDYITWQSGQIDQLSTALGTPAS